MLRRVAAFCRPLRPVLPLVLFPRSQSPVVGVLGLCWMWRDGPFARQQRPVVGILRLCWLLWGSFDCFCCPRASVLRPSRYPPPPVPSEEQKSSKHTVRTGVFAGRLDTRDVDVGFPLEVSSARITASTSATGGCLGKSCTIVPPARRVQRMPCPTNTAIVCLGGTSLMRHLVQVTKITWVHGLSRVAYGTQAVLWPETWL